MKCKYECVIFISVGAISCIKNVTVHNAPILSINAGEQWLGIGAADSSMSLFNRPQDRLGGLSTPGPKMAGWQLYRTPLKSAATVFLFPVYFSLCTRSPFPLPQHYTNYYLLQWLHTKPNTRIVFSLMHPIFTMQAIT